MRLRPDQEKILQQFHRQENLLSELYSIFATQFPAYKDFWAKLSIEENKHAKLVEKLGQASRKGVVLFDEGSIKTFALDTFLKRLETIVERANKGEINIGAAFTFAADYETSLIEKNVFTRFGALTEKSKGVLLLLNAETLEHVERVKKMQKGLRLQKNV